MFSLAKSLFDTYVFAPVAYTIHGRGIAPEIEKHTIEWLATLLNSSLFTFG